MSEQTQQKVAFKGMRFCSECDNMLEPREYQNDGRYFLQY